VKHTGKVPSHCWTIGAISGSSSIGPFTFVFLARHGWQAVVIHRRLLLGPSDFELLAVGPRFSMKRRTRREKGLTVAGEGPEGEGPHSTGRA
jgi:hypothetical protein